MKVFVTGADGFIGSHLVELLLSKNVKSLLFAIIILTGLLDG